jgi:ABC-type transport system substrate-binding protein
LSDTSRIIGEVIKADAAKIGIDLELNAHDSGAFNKANQAGQYNCFIDIWSAAIDPHYTVQWHTSDNDWNITHWSSATFDDLVKKGASELDLKKRAEIYIQMQKIMDKECFAIWLTHGVRALAVQKSVNAGKIYPNGRLAPWNINFEK